MTHVRPLKVDLTVFAADGACESLFLLSACRNEDEMSPVALANASNDSY